MITTGSVYVSGSVRDIEQVRKVQNDFIENGWDIAHDWTQYTGSKFGSEAEEEATKQFRAIEECDLFVLVEHPKLKAGWMELGAALAYEKLIVVQRHPDVNASLWYSLISGITFVDRN